LDTVPGASFGFGSEDEGIKEDDGRASERIGEEEMGDCDRFENSSGFISVKKGNI
jgi:hypothetical protein